MKIKRGNVKRLELLCFKTIGVKNQKFEPNIKPSEIFSSEHSVGGGK